MIVTQFNNPFLFCLPPPAGKYYPTNHTYATTTGGGGLCGPGANSPSYFNNNKKRSSGTCGYESASLTGTPTLRSHHGGSSRSNLSSVATSGRNGSSGATNKFTFSTSNDNQCSVVKNNGEVTSTLTQPTTKKDHRVTKSNSSVTSRTSNLDPSLSSSSFSRKKTQSFSGKDDLVSRSPNLCVPSPGALTNRQVDAVDAIEDDEKDGSCCDLTTQRLLTPPTVNGSVVAS